jgi:nucleoside-diphosphate-sugar epimerase
MKTLFFTGATGALAPFLIHRLLHEEGTDRFVCLARSAGARDRLARRIRTICEDCAGEVGPERFTFVAGDVTDDIPDSGRVDSVWHFAGDLRMDSDSEKEVFATNVGGTQHVLDLCRRTGATLYDVSTAYVCGTRSGRVREDELSCGQAFRNAYEDSKARSEELVREHLRQSPGMVFRPSIVLGDTRTGVTLTFAGFYKVLWAAARLRDRLTGFAGSLLSAGGKGLTLTLPCASLEEKVNLVAAEYVTDLLVRLHADSSALGRTFHLTNPTPPSIGDLLGVLTEVIGLRGVRLVPEGPGHEEAGEGVRDLTGTLGDHVLVYFPYLAGSHPDFDMSNVAAVCGGIPPHPPLDHAAWERLYGYAAERDFAAVY